MIAHLCDAAPCTKPARFLVTYDPKQSAMEVCRDDLSWPVELSLHSGGNVHVAVIDLPSQ